jgi:hypothetical protein
MTYFDEQSPPELIEERVKMDMAIQTAQSRLEIIKSDGRTGARLRYVRTDPHRL